jgi:hypothetical protein
MFLEKKDIRRKDSFPCPCCHKLLRARQSTRARFVSGFVAFAGALLSSFAIGHGSHAIRNAGGLIVVFGVAFDFVFRFVSPRVKIEPAEGGPTAVL